MAPGDSDIVTFENRTDQVVAFIKESPHNSTPNLKFILQPRGSYEWPVPGEDARTYEQLTLVDGEDENGRKTNVTITTDQLRQLGGFKLIVTKTGNGFNELEREDIRKSWVHEITDRVTSIFKGRQNRDQLPT